MSRQDPYYLVLATDGSGRSAKFRYLIDALAYQRANRIPTVIIDETEDAPF